MKTLVILLALLALASCSEKSEESVLKIAVDVPYEPFEFKAPDGSLTGFEIDLGNAVCEQMQTKCEWVVQAWDGIIPGLLAFKYDIIMSSMSINDERKQQVAFTKPYYNTPSAWFGKTDSGLEVSDSKAMAGKKIGVQRGTVQDAYATENYPESTIQRYATADEIVIDLYGGRLDAVLIDYPVGESTILKGDKGGEYSQTGERLQIGEGVAVALRKDDSELLDKLNSAFDTVKSNGSYEAIEEKYFDYSIKM